MTFINSILHNLKLELFKNLKQFLVVGELFGFKPRTSSALCASWVESGFLTIVDSSNRGRKYKLSAETLIATF